VLKTLTRAYGADSFAYFSRIFTA